MRTPRGNHRTLPRPRRFLPAIPRNMHLWLCAPLRPHGVQLVQDAARQNMQPPRVHADLDPQPHGPERDEGILAVLADACREGPRQVQASAEYWQDGCDGIQEGVHLVRRARRVLCLYQVYAGLQLREMLLGERY